MSNVGSINACISAIENIETELGILPSGPYADVRTRLDVLESRINNPNIPAPSGQFITIGNTDVFVVAGYGDPTTNSVVAAPGSIYLREDGYTNQGLYSMRPDGYWYQIDTAPWTAAGDLSGDEHSQTVIGIDGYTLPSLSLGYLNWTGTTWSFTQFPALETTGVIAGTYGTSTTYPVITVDGYGRVTSATTDALPVTSLVAGANVTVSNIGGSWTINSTAYGFTAGGDLSGTSTSQQVIQISGATGNFDWAATTINPSIIHKPEITDTGATNIIIRAQDAWTSAVTNVYGGSMTLQAGSASDSAPGASITLDGASPRSVANASDIVMGADQMELSAATTAAANTLILDPINAAIYFNSSSPAPSIGTTSRYFTNTYTNNIYVNQITNTTAPTAGQFLAQNASANGIEWVTAPALNGSLKLNTASKSASYTINGGVDCVIVAVQLGITITLPLSPNNGDTYIVKDGTGIASMSNGITISGNGNLIDGQPSYPINLPYESATFTFNGLGWSLI